VTLFLTNFGVFPVALRDETQLKIQGLADASGRSTVIEIRIEIRGRRSTLRPEGAAVSAKAPHHPAATWGL
jgi:hypothetical protein